MPKVTPQELFDAGKLGEAVTAALEQVKEKPADAAARGLLCELLCFTGDVERADRQLDVLGDIAPERMPAVALFRQLLRAEQARQQFFTEGRAPELVAELTPYMKLHLEASVCLREGRGADAAKLLAEAETTRP